MPTFEEACAAKFDRGRREHGKPWDAAYIDAPREMQDELCDLANYSTLLPNQALAATIRGVAKLLWRVLQTMHA